MAVYFRNKDGKGDAPFLEWLAENPTGYVINTNDHPTEYLNLHLARCYHFRSSRYQNPFGFTGNGYIKICGNDLAELLAEGRRYTAGVSEFSPNGKIAHKSGCCMKSAPPLPSEALILAAEEKLLMGETLSALLAQAESRNTEVGKRRTTQSTVYVRAPVISAFAKKAAEGACSMCDLPAPQDIKSEDFLDCHHIVFLSEGGADTADNVIALCPNCHRIAHTRPSENDVEKMRRIAQERIDKCRELPRT